MKPWNPYAMTFHGQPIVGQTPPKLVVYGPPLTAQQGAMLQTAYNAFVGAARVSIVPNPTRQGRLLDGSPYTIECSQGVCTCTVWTTTKPSSDLGDVFSGIIFKAQDNTKTVAVNIGGGGISTGEWELKDVSAVPMNHNQQTWGAVYNNRMKPSPSVLLGGKERYVYRTDSFTGRYGNETVFHGFSAVLGLTKTRDALLVLKATPSIREVYVSDRIDMKAVFKDFGAPIAGHVSATFPNPPQVLFENQSTGDGETKLDGYEFSVPRSGNSVVFGVTERTGLLSNADIEEAEDGFRRYPLGRPFFYYVSWSSGALIVVADYGRQARKYKTFKKKVLRCSREGDAFTAPTTIYEVPQQQAYPVDTPVVDFSPVDGVGTSTASTAINLAEKYAPTSIPTAYLEEGGPGGAWAVKGSSTRTGPIGGRLTKTEKNYDVYPHYVGEKLVLLEWTNELEYEEVCSGNMNDVRLNGTWSTGYYPNPPSFPDAGAVLGDALTKRLTFNNEVTARLRINTFYTLEGGERFFLEKYSYDEESSYDFYEEEIWTPRVNHPPLYFFSTDLKGTITYTVDREQRSLLVYDPEMDVLCYTEVVFKATRSSWARIAGETTEYTGNANETTTSGAARPEVPDIYIKLRCKGVTQDVAVKPLNMPPYGDLSLLPATGVSPYATGGAIGTSQAFVSWSPRGYGSYGSLRNLGPNDLKLGPRQTDGDAVRGLAPPIHIPIDVSAEYVKTPETGAAFLRVRIDAYGATEYHSYFVDSVAGVRRADDLFPGFTTDGSTAGVF